jgi:hypothetical protein
MFPTGGSNPQSQAERLRQEGFERLGGTEGIEALPGVRELREWGETQREQQRLEQQQREEDRQEALRVQAQEEMRGLEARMKERYLRAGGTAEEWPQAWPSIKAQILEERALTEAKPGVDYRSSLSAF